MANFTRWVVEKTGGFVKTFEMWNEAFGLVWDNPGGVKGKGFGPGGSKQNADNYASMMLPSVAVIRAKLPTAKIAVEGNYCLIALLIDICCTFSIPSNAS